MPTEIGIMMYMEPSIPILMGELLEREDFIKSAVEAEWRVELWKQLKDLQSPLNGD